MMKTFLLRPNRRSRSRSLTTLLPQQLSRNFFYQVTRHVIGEELVQGLKIYPQYDYPGIQIMQRLGRSFSFVHDSVPGGEAFLYRLGVHGFKRQLWAAERRDQMKYGVKVHETEAVRTGDAASRAA